MSSFMQQLADAQAAAEGASTATTQVRTMLRRQPERLGLEVPIRVVVFLLMNAAGAGFAFVSLLTNPVVGFAGATVLFILSIVVICMIHVAAQWERGVVLRLGSFQSVRGPGLVIIFPVIDYLRMIDTRTQTLEIPQQRVITRDNVPVSINGVLYFRVSNVESAMTKIQDYEFGILQYAQAALRDCIGRLTLDELLAERDQIQKEIEEAVERNAQAWGLEIDALRLQDIDMPEELKKMMSRQASAEREKRATITKAEGDKLAALNLAEAAHTMYASPGAMQLRTLQTIDSLGPSPSNTVVLAVPMDVFTLVSKMSSGQVAIPGVKPATEPEAPTA